MALRRLVVHPTEVLEAPPLLMMLADAYRGELKGAITEDLFQSAVGRSYRQPLGRDNPGVPYYVVSRRSQQSGEQREDCHAEKEFFDR
jgi:hypothetical protein